MSARPSRPRPASRKFALNLLAGFLPAAVAGLAARDFIKAHLFQGNTARGDSSWARSASSSSNLFGPDARIESAEDLPLTTAFGVGAGAGPRRSIRRLASGATNHGRVRTRLFAKGGGGVLLFLAVPVMFAATGLDLYKSGTC